MGVIRNFKPVPTFRRAIMKQRTKTDWEKLVREYRSSGKSLRVWCDENGINYKTMCGYTHLVPAHNEKRTEKEWIDLISKKQASGMTREGWCRENGVNPNSMLSAEKRLKAKLDSGNTVSAKQLPTRTQEKEPIEESQKTNTDVESHTDYANPKWAGRSPGGELLAPATWIEIGIGEPPKPTLSPESRSFSNIRPSDSFDDEKIKDCKDKKSKLFDSKIMIRCGKLTIEADAGYPSEHLENLIGRLAAVC
jgi:hypothetical protein